MKPSELKKIVLNAIDNFHYELPPPGTTYGVPWSKEKVKAKVEEMRTCIVDPYMAEILFHDSIEQIKADPQIRKKCWVVAEDSYYILVVDPDDGDFVLAQRSDLGGWVTIGVRGDAVTTFIARQRLRITMWCTGLAQLWEISNALAGDHYRQK